MAQTPLRVFGGFKGTNDDNIIRNNIIHSRTGSLPRLVMRPIFAIVIWQEHRVFASSDTISILNNIVYDFRETADDGFCSKRNKAWHKCFLESLNGWKGISVNIYNNGGLFII